MINQPSQRGDKSSIFEEEFDEDSSDQSVKKPEVEESGWESSSEESKPKSSKKATSISKPESRLTVNTGRSMAKTVVNLHGSA